MFYAYLVIIMKPAEGRFPKINLEKEAKRCGNCRFCGRNGIYIIAEDMEKLKTFCKEILSAKSLDPLVKPEPVINVLALCERLGKEKMYCQREHTWTHLLEPSCSFWQQRNLKQSNQA